MKTVKLTLRFFIFHHISMEDVAELTASEEEENLSFIKARDKQK